jgi:hypothetical protein
VKKAVSLPDGYGVALQLLLFVQSASTVPFQMPFAARVAVDVNRLMPAIMRDMRPAAVFFIPIFFLLLNTLAHFFDRLLS